MALDRLYRDRAALADLGERGRKRVNEDRFRWEHIGAEYVKVLGEVLSKPMPEVKVEALA